jgi:hypothetical protein
MVGGPPGASLPFVPRNRVTVCDKAAQNTAGNAPGQENRDPQANPPQANPPQANPQAKRSQDFMERIGDRKKRKRNNVYCSNLTPLIHTDQLTSFQRR